MRILICNYEYPPLGGGGGVVTALLAEELARRHEVTVLTSQGLGLPSESVEEGVRVVRAPVFFRKQKAAANLPSMLAFIPMGIRLGKRLLKKERFDVINTHFALPAGPVGNALARSAGIPNILSVHRGDLYDPSKFTSPHRHPLLRWWIKRLARRADAVVGQSSNTIDNLRNYFTPDVSSERIPLGIKKPEFSPSSRSKYGFREDEVILATLGRLVTRKANEQLISMMAALKNEALRLVIMGSGPQEEFLREEAQRLGVSHRVSFMGFVDDTEKFELLEMSDIYVSTSQHEGFGLVFLEAMHCGLPIVCYDHGGQTDFLRDDKTGFVVKLNDEEAFKGRLRQLIDNGEMRSRLGDHNRQAVNDYYIDNCARMYEEVFEIVVSSVIPQCL